MGLKTWKALVPALGLLSEEKGRAAGWEGGGEERGEATGKNTPTSPPPPPPPLGVSNGDPPSMVLGVCG